MMIMMMMMMMMRTMDWFSCRCGFSLLLSGYMEETVVLAVVVVTGMEEEKCRNRLS
jgi:hypothetical protein